MRIAVEHAGAERGVLIAIRNKELHIEASARSGRGTIEVSLRRKQSHSMIFPNPCSIT